MKTDPILQQIDRDGYAVLAAVPTERLPTQARPAVKMRRRLGSIGLSPLCCPVGPSSPKAPS